MRILIYFFILVIFSCSEHRAHANRIIVIQPFNDFPNSLTGSVYNQIKKINPNTILRRSIQLPVQSYYSLRSRYRADSLIHYLSRFGNEDTVIIGLTYKDISTTKGNVADWGIMGLGYCPGKACIVSTFRLDQSNSSEQFYKVAIHELGHTQGLPHCSNKQCFMRDAEGGNHLNEEKGFCSSCKLFLKKNGWHLN